MEYLNPPQKRPKAPYFSSGPCCKHPGWSPKVLVNALVGRSHRSAPALERLREVITRIRTLLSLPEAYRIALIPASDTGAVEAALWSLLGPRGIDVLSWDAFGDAWVTDITQQLKCSDVRVIRAPWGQLPDLNTVDTKTRDVVFTWNGTTSGVCVPDGDWIAKDREGLTICDATSAIFAVPLPFEKLDVVTFSWQKVLGGEAAHGMLILSPRAVDRLKAYTPSWPIPKIFRLAHKGRLNEKLFEGEPINTPSLLCVEDILDALKWTESVGGLSGLEARVQANAHAVAEWVAQTPWIDYLAQDLRIRSCTSVCLSLTCSKLKDQDDQKVRAFVDHMAQILEQEGVAYDIESHREAPPGLRLWCGATVEAEDLKCLFPWLEWAFHKTCRKILENCTEVV